MNPKRIILAAMAAGAVALFVEPAAAESTLRSAVGYINDPYCTYNCYPQPDPYGGGGSDLLDQAQDIVNTVEDIVNTAEDVVNTVGDWLGF